VDLRVANDDDRRSLAAARLERVATILLIAVTALVGGVTVWDRVQGQPTRVAGQELPARTMVRPPADPVSIEGAPVRGDARAKVALIVFSDFECPYCAKSALDVLPEIERQYLRTGKLRLVWRHLPLSIHKNARQAAEAAECAHGQGKFWEFHDWAFQHQTQLDMPNLHEAARTIGLDLAGFRACVDGQATGRVDADLDTAKALSVTRTPTWLIGVIQEDGRVRVMERLDGSRAFFVFQGAIDQVIATADASN
jgi:protein-disulfide isomerase